MERVTKEVWIRANKDLVYIDTQMEMYIKVTGKTIWSREKESWLIQMEINIKDNGCVVRNKERVFIGILQEFFTKECF